MSKGKSLYINYRETHPFQERQKECVRIRSKYPGRIPVICEVLPESQNTVQMKKNKFLVPLEFTAGEFMYFLRKNKISASHEEALFLFIDGHEIPKCSDSLSSIYYNNKHEDGFLYLGIMAENTFG